MKKFRRGLGVFIKVINFSIIGQKVLEIIFRWEKISFSYLLSDSTWLWPLVITSSIYVVITTREIERT